MSCYKKLFFLIFVSLFSLPVMASKHNLNFHDSISIELTEQEKAFIQQHPTIKVANELDWPPFDYNEFGQPKGLSIDHIKLLADKVGLKIEFIYGYTWAELVNLFKHKKLDVILGFYRNNERAKFTRFITPYYRGNLGIYTRIDNTSIYTRDDLAGKKVGIQKSDGSLFLIKQSLPKANFIEFDTNSNLVEALANQKLDAIIGNPLLFFYYAKENHVTNLHLVDYMDISLQQQLALPLYIGVRKDWELLHSILQKAKDAVSDTEMKTLTDLWTLNPSYSQTRKVKLNDKEQHFLKTHPEVILVNGYSFEPFSIENADGSFSGFMVDLVQIIQAKTGLKIRFKHGVWQDMQAPTIARKYDGFASARMTKEWKKYFLSSDAYLELYHLAIVKKDNPKKISKLEDIGNHRIALPEKNKLFEKIIKKTVNKPNIVYTKTTLEQIENIVFDRADIAIVDESVHYIARKRGVSDMIETPFTVDKPFQVAFVLRNDWPELTSIINKALRDIDDIEMLKIKEKWFSKGQLSATQRTTMDFSPEQKKYLQHKKKLKICVTPDWMPYEKLDHGQYIGIGSDYFELVKQHLGIAIELLPTTSWQQSLDFAKNGDCDLLPSVFKTPSRQQHFNFTTPYLKLPIVIATKSEVAFISDFSKLTTQKIGIPDDSAYTELLKQQYPNLNLVVVKSVQEGLRKVVSGELFGHIGALGSIGHCFQTEFAGELKIAGKFDNLWGLSIAVSHDEKILFDILEKIVNYIGEDQVKAIVNKHIAIHYEQEFNYASLYKYFIAIAIGLIFFIYRQVLLHKLNRTLKERVREKTQALQTLNEELEDKVKERTVELESSKQRLQELVYRDPLTNVYNRRYFEQTSEILLTLAQREKKSLSFLMLDIDVFKRVNDNYGHDVGDEVIKCLADTLQKYARKSDIVARFGGEEFVLLLNNTDKKTGLETAEKIRAYIEQQSVAVNADTHIKFTVSIGIDSIAADQSKDIFTALKNADKALYEAKNRGRNQCVLAIDDISSTKNKT